MQRDISTAPSLARESGEALIGTRNPSLMDALFPSLTTVQRALLALAAVVVLAICGKLHFYLPDNPVPITFQTAGVLMMGGFLGWRWGLGGNHCVLLAWHGRRADVRQSRSVVGYCQRLERQSQALLAATSSASSRQCQ